MQRKRTSSSIPIRRLRCRSCWSSHDERDHPAGTPPSRLIAGGEIRRCPRLGVRRHRAPEPGRLPLCSQAPRTPSGARRRCCHANGLRRDVSLHRSLRRGASRGCDHTARLAAERHGRTRWRRSHDPRLVRHVLPTSAPVRAASLPRERPPYPGGCARAVGRARRARGCRTFSRTPQPLPRLPPQHTLPPTRYGASLVNPPPGAAALIVEIGSPAVLIVADTYHMNIEEADPAGALLEVAPHIGHLQASDSNRLEPGAGHLDWALFGATVAAIGYKRSIAIESRLSGEAATVLPTVPPLLRRYL